MTITPFRSRRESPVPSAILRRSAARRHQRSIVARIVIGALLAGVVAIPVLLAGLLPLQDPQAQDLSNRLMAPSSEHWFGTDQLGRDLFARVLYGGQISLRIGLLAVLLSGAVGVAAGVAAGWRGGLVDTIVSRVLEAQMSLPLLLFMLLVAALFGTSITVITLILALAQWPEPARLARAVTLREREKLYVDSARVLGSTSWGIVRRHILPNIFGQVLVVVLLLLTQAVLLESALSYLGVGVARPYPTWGRIIADGQATLTSAWWVVVLPGLVVVMFVIGVNLLGEGLRDKLGGRR